LKKISIILSTSILFSQNIFAINSEIIGDALLGLIPLSTYGTTLYLNDKEGKEQFYKSFATNATITYGLKYGVNRRRPNGEKHSFPSGHTSATFQSASFIHKRYGLTYALPAYIGATFVGYSRVHADAHYSSDVIAGAIIGSLSSFYFITPYKKVKIQPIVMKKGYGIGVNFTW
jgi:membrane-associated phospholipid phosphatase